MSIIAIRKVWRLLIMKNRNHGLSEKEPELVKLLMAN